MFIFAAFNVDCVLLNVHGFQPPPETLDFWLIFNNCTKAGKMRNIETTGQVPTGFSAPAGALLTIKHRKKKVEKGKQTHPGAVRGIFSKWETDFFALCLFSTINFFVDGAEAVK